MFLLCCLVLLSCDLPFVGSSLPLKDGPSLQIPLGLQTQDLPFLVLWKKEGVLLGRIRGGQCTYGCNKTSSVLSNGSLLLGCIKREDEGTYIANVYNESGVLIYQAEIHLQVVDVFTDHVIDVNLESGSSDQPKQVVWSKGAEKVGYVSKGVCVLGCTERSHVFSNGSLFIRSVQKADEGIYSVRTLNSSLSPLLHSHIFLYVNVSDVEPTNDSSNDGSTSVSSIFFISMICVSCLGAFTFTALGRFLWMKGKNEKSDDDKSCVSYTEIRRKNNRNVTGSWAEMGGNKEEIGEAATLSTFQ